MSRTLFVIAGEPSGDKLGAAAMAALRAREPDIRFAGIGGPLMEAEGLTSLFPMSDLSVMGLAEVLPRLRHLFRRRDEAVTALADLRPDGLLTIDSPDFCLRVAAKAKAARPGLPVLHYVAPTVWVWRPGRARKMARHVDHVLALFPFEPPYMEAAGMTCDFVGHPVVAERWPGSDEVAAFRESVSGEGPLITVLPGSRRGEIERLAPIFGEALGRMPNARYVVPAAGHVAGLVREAVADWSVDVTVLDPTGLAPQAAEHRKRSAMAAADAALAASGTVALELAMAGTPFVSAYRMAPLSAFIIRRMVNVKSANLINILLDDAVVPEVLQEACTPDRIVSALTPLLGPAGDAQAARQAEAMALLGLGGEHPGDRAATSILNALDRLSG